jgi:DNA-binding winged helix-turn-helix (wHTH) protein/tetratricopeptide (TPR) repeat protein
MTTQGLNNFQYEFGDFRIDTAKHLLLRDGVPVALTPKAFDTLLALVEKGGEAVTKDDLLSEIWPDTIVEEGSLARNISVLRKVLDEGRAAHEYIETIPRVGYRFVSRVRKVYDGSAVRSVAVLPFETIGAQGDDYLGVGMADALITKLSNVRQIITRPTSAVLRYAGPGHDALTSGRELGTDAVLDGRIQRAGDSIRVTVQFLDVPGKSLLWAGKFDEQFTNVFTLQDSISEKVIQALTLELTGEQRRRVSKNYTQDTAAYQSYLKGRFFWSKRDPASLLKGIESFGLAIGQDENYALAYSGLVDCYVLLVMYGVMPPGEAMNVARAAAERAVALDDSLAEAHTSMAYLKATYDWDWRGSEKEFARAVALNPGYSTAHHWGGVYSLMRGNVDEALGRLTLAQKFDPLSLSINTDIGWAYYFARQYEQAVEQYLKTIELDPNFLRVYWFLGQTYVQQGRFEEAVAALSKALALNDHPLSSAFLGHAYGLWGRKREALAVLEGMREMSERRYVAPYFMALVYIGIEDYGRAFEWLDKVLEERFWVLAFLDIDPTFDRLRERPEYAAFRRRVEDARVV